ncbi:MAG TPA: TetR/AcrR family transcriptional regulator [Hyphomicrobiaceae bacterium]|jgi:AcrR family transcriptional regulator
MKERIKEIAVELLVRDGYQGFRFRDLADRLGITRANIHYYYGSKLNLAEEVIVDYVRATLAAWEENWRSDKTFEQKIRGMMESNRQRYLRFNPTGTTGHPWSLIGRMRMERDVIGPEARAALVEFGVVLEDLVVKAIEKAIQEGELSPEIPIRDIALQLVAIANSAGPITQDGGSFDRLEQLYLSFARIVDHAYGRRPGRKQGRSEVAKAAKRKRPSQPRSGATVGTSGEIEQKQSAR